VPPPASGAPRPTPRHVALAPEELAELRRPAAEAPRRLTRSELDGLLGEVGDRDEVARLVLDFLAQDAPRVALFRVKRDEVAGWMARGSGVDEGQFRAFRTDASEPSVFVGLAQGGSHYRGPLAPLPVHRQLARAWGGRLPRECVLVPVRLKGRLVTVIYSDNDRSDAHPLATTELQSVAAAMADAFERCIVRQKGAR
jgi:hypothetical protein